jgi:CARDB
MRPRSIIYGCDLAPLPLAALSTAERTMDKIRGIKVGFVPKLALSACLLTATCLGASAIDLPDLVPTSLSYDSASGLFTVGVKNQGAAATPSNVVVGNGFFVDGAWVSWGAVPGPLAPGASVSIRSTGGGAYTIPPGTHAISVLVDDVNRIPESNEGNNGLSQAITIGSRICTPPTNVYDTSSQFIFYPGATINWTFSPPGSNANYTIVDAYGNRLTSGALYSSSTSVKYTPPAGAGFYRLNVYNPSGSLIRMLTAATIPLPCNWSIGRNAFGAGTWGWGSWGFDQTYLARFGFSWRRGELDTIGLSWPARQSTIPTGTANLAAYQSRMQTYIANPANDTFDLDAPELWNEPIFFLKVPVNYSWAQYVAAFRAARAGILAAKPTWRVAMNQIDAGNFASVNAEGGSELYDIMVWHPYSAATWRNECKSAEHSGPWIYGTDFLSNFELARTQVPFKESWSTEFGWPTAPGYGWSCTELQQAKFIVRSALLQLGQGFTHVLPFTLTNVSFWDAQTGSFGLNYGDSNLRPTMPKASMASYAVLAQTVDNLPYVGRFACGVNCAEFLFGNSSASVLIFWNPQRQQTFSIASALPPGTAEIGLFGSRRNVGGAAYSVTMGDSPTYLVFDGIAPAQVVPLVTQPYITGRAKGIFSGVTQ